MAVKLRCVEGENPGAVYVLGPGESRVFGRHRSADVVIADPLLSRHHLMVRVGEGGSAVALDLNSLNGTFLNECPIDEAPLSHGDRLRIGAQVFAVEIDRPPAGAAPLDSADTVAAMVFCARCHRAMEAPSRRHAPWKTFVCDRCREAEGSTLDARAIEGWVLLRKVRDTAYGPVYEAAEDAPGGRRGLVKLIAPEKVVDRRAMELFTREAAIGQKLVHPSIVQLIATGERNGLYYLIEELPPGRALSDHLRERGALPPREALFVAREVARALAFAFERGVVHRNVHPAAIFLGPGDAPEAAALGLAYGRVRLGDFGLAKPLNSEKSGTSGITKAGEWKGVLNYVAPEQLANAATVDQRADVYGLGATLYHMLSGRAPYEATSPLRTLRRIGEGDLTPLLALAPATPPPVAALVARAMEREAARRFQSPKEMLEAVEAAERGLG